MLSLVEQKVWWYLFITKIRADQDALDEYERLKKEVDFLNQVIFVIRF